MHYTLGSMLEVTVTRSPLHRQVQHLADSSEFSPMAVLVLNCHDEEFADGVVAICSSFGQRRFACRLAKIGGVKGTQVLQGALSHCAPVLDELRGIGDTLSEFDTTWRFAGIKKVPGKRAATLGDAVRDSFDHIFFVQGNVPKDVARSIQFLMHSLIPLLLGYHFKALDNWVECVLKAPLNEAFLPDVLISEEALFAHSVCPAHIDSLTTGYVKCSRKSNPAIRKEPVAVYIEKAYEEGDFSGLGVGT